MATLTCYTSNQIKPQRREGAMTYKSINSTKFPRLMFKRAPIVSPASDAIFSVASVRRADRGTIAMAFVANIHAGGELVKYVANPIGTKERRKLM